jgi:hypothetical protein
MTMQIESFSAFFDRAMKNKNKKIKKGKYKGQNRAITKKDDIPLPGPKYRVTPRSGDAPSSSTFVTKG